MYIRIKDHVIRWITTKGNEGGIDLRRGVYPLILTSMLAGILWIVREDPTVAFLEGFSILESIMIVVVSILIYSIVFLMIRIVLLELSSSDDEEDSDIQ